MKTLLVNANVLTIPLADNSVHCVVSSPPYWGLRDYSTNGQLGLERTPEEYIARMVEVFREVRRVLHPEGVMFLNVGDSYASDIKGSGGPTLKQVSNTGSFYEPRKLNHGLKPKDLVGIPWRLALALQADGWWLRSDIIWAKPNPMPESVTDRPTKAHEYVFLMTKSQKYFWDQEGVREEHAPASLPRAMRGLSEDNKWTNGAPGSTAHTMSQARSNAKLGKGYRFGSDGYSGYVDSNGRLLINPNGRNLRTVWTIATQPYSGAHYATFPPSEKDSTPCPATTLAI